MIIEPAVTKLCEIAALVINFPALNFISDSINYYIAFNDSIFQMQLLFTSKISHHNQLCHYFGEINIQVLCFSEENGAMKITFGESTPWIILLNSKAFKLYFCT